jgi:unsaturated rhamnogalacturonyl hydrolase
MNKNSPLNQCYISSIGADGEHVAEKGFDGLVTELVRIDANGQVSLTNICGSAGLGGIPFRDGSFEYYIGEPRVDNDPHGVGPFILAALELDR